jgi:hypothetical protein
LLVILSVPDQVAGAAAAIFNSAWLVVPPSMLIVPVLVLARPCADTVVARLKLPTCTVPLLVSVPPMVRLPPLVPPLFTYRLSVLVRPTLVVSVAPPCNSNCPALLVSPVSAVSLAVPRPAAAINDCAPRRLICALLAIAPIPPLPPYSSSPLPETSITPVHVAGADAAMLNSAWFVVPPSMLIVPVLVLARPCADTVVARLLLPICTLLLLVSVPPMVRLVPPPPLPALFTSRLPLLVRPPLVASSPPFCRVSEAETVTELTVPTLVVIWGPPWPMTTSSPAPGTLPLLQSLPLVQLPEPSIQLIVAMSLAPLASFDS